ncbi:MAG TPA: aldose epimerase family protein [Verrucomicrobiae bacterium]|nr:aldose epimerase family protein [Verrucomicrobiae bacterium]
MPAPAPSAQANPPPSSQTFMTQSSITHEPFGKTQDGQPVEIYTLQNDNGMVVRILTYGGIIQTVKVPDKNGQMGDVALGYDTLDGYLTNSPYFGALIGRYGNRIAKGHFTLDGKEYTLFTNNVPNSLHGGRIGFDKRVWTVDKADVGRRGPELVLSYTSPDGEENYPGTLQVTATYTLLDNENTLRLRFRATTDKDTIVNLTGHSYFNLAGQGQGTILDQIVYIDADNYTPVDSTLIPTGEIAPVAGTPFDFRTPTAIGARINEDNEQLKFAGGYDQNFVMNHPAGKLGLDARVTDPKSGRVLEIDSTSPGLQFYSGNFLDGTIVGKGGAIYLHRGAFAMEPQHYPDSPNHPNFPSTVLHPGEVYHNTIVYKFSVASDK